MHIQVAMPMSGLPLEIITGECEMVHTPSGLIPHKLHA
jgi:hypothetical protein